MPPATSPNPASSALSGVVRTSRTWAEMIKFSHSVFALPFALFATFLAARPGLPTLPEVGLIIVCMVAARSAAMTFNRLIDAGYDAANPRTARRALPAEEISRSTAWSFFFGAGLIFIIACWGFWWGERNPWPLILSVPTLGFLCLYSYTKRFTRWSHLVLGAAIAFSPVAAWIAIDPASLGLSAVLLMLAVTCWIAGFDLIYACQDVAFDRAAGLHSVPARLGIAPALWLARGLHGVTAASLIALGWHAELGIIYYAGVAIVSVVLAAENALVRPTDLSRVNLAFFTLNGIVSLVLGALGMADILIRLP